MVVVVSIIDVIIVILRSTLLIAAVGRTLHYANIVQGACMGGGW